MLRCNASLFATPFPAVTGVLKKPQSEFNLFANLFLRICKLGYNTGSGPSMKKLFLGRQIRSLRENAQLTQRDFAERLGLSTSYVNQLENNQRPVSAPVLLSLGEHFGLDLASLSVDDNDRLIAALQEVFADPVFAGSRPGLQDFKMVSQNAPDFAHALVRLHQAYRQMGEQLARFDDRLVRDEGLARPILIGRPEVIEVRLRRIGLRMRLQEQVEIINPQSDPRFPTYWQTYHQIMQRRGVTPETAKQLVRTNATIIGALAVRLGDADALIAGPNGRYHRHLEHIRNVLGKAPGVRDFSALSLLILPSGTLFLADTYVSEDPSAEELVEMTLLAAEQVRHFGIEPKVALLSHSAFGSADSETARKMRTAVALLHAEAPDLEVEGEMHGDAAILEELRQRSFPNSRLRGQANLLIFPNLDAANIAFNLMKATGSGLSVGPILVGGAASAHIVTPSVTARGVVNMTAVAAAEATARKERGRGA